jgi:hypothetical protein
MSVTVVEVTEVGAVLTDPASIDEAVQNGMRLIDEEFGTTMLDKLNPDSLDVSSGISCVCGQLFGSYSAGKDKLGISSDKEAAKYGFFSLSVTKYRELTEAWRNALLARSA